MELSYPLAMAVGGFGLTDDEVPGHGGENEGFGEVGEVAGAVSARGIGPRWLAVGESGRRLEFCHGDFQF